MQGRACSTQTNLADAVGFVIKARKSRVATANGCDRFCPAQPARGGMRRLTRLSSSRAKQ